MRKARPSRAVRRVGKGARTPRRPKALRRRASASTPHPAEGQPARLPIRLSATGEDYRRMVENLDVGVFRVTGDPKGRCLQANPALARILGYPSVEEFMAVRDNGVGLDPSAKPGKGLGLYTMRQRAEAVGGQLTIASRPGRTVVEAGVPLPAQPEAPAGHRPACSPAARGTEAAEG